MNYQDAPTHSLTIPLVYPVIAQCGTRSVSRKILSIFGRVFKSKPANR